MLIAISLGGSLLSKASFDLDAVLKALVATEHSYIIVVGGGTLARDLFDQHLDDEANCRIGIAVTRVNAQIVREHLRNLTDDVDDVAIALGKVRRRFTIAGGTEPGRTTDDVMVQFAIENSADSCINLTDVDHVYDRDPSEPDARALDEIDWDSYLNMIGDFKPGMHAPFDPVASCRARDAQLSVIVIDGSDVKALKTAIMPGDVGTRLHPAGKAF